MYLFIYCNHNALCSEVTENVSKRLTGHGLAAQLRLKCIKTLRNHVSREELIPDEMI